MSRRRGFTLAEMLAVIGIMLVLMVTAFGVFSSFAERAGPETAVSTVQAMLNGARDYAASNGVVAAVYFSGDLARPEDGTAVRLRYKPVGASEATAWIDVRGRSVINLGPNMYACKDLPNVSGFGSVGNAQSESDVAQWKANEAALMGVSGSITKQATTGGNLNFYVAFDPSGYLKSMGGSQYAQDGVTVVQLFQVGTDTSKARVVAYALYPFNSISGTRLIFDF